MLTHFPPQQPGNRAARAPAPPRVGVRRLPALRGGRVLGFERNVPWPGPASSIGEMPVTTTSPSPTSRAPIRTARSVSRTSFTTGILLVHQFEHLGGGVQRGIGVDDPAAL